MEVVNLQTQKSIAKLPQMLVGTEVDIFHMFLSLFYSVIQSGYIMFSLHLFLSYFLITCTAPSLFIFFLF